MPSDGFDFGDVCEPTTTTTTESCRRRLRVGRRPSGMDGPPPAARRHQRQQLHHRLRQLQQQQQLMQQQQQQREQQLQRRQVLTVPSPATAAAVPLLQTPPPDVVRELSTLLVRECVVLALVAVMVVIGRAYRWTGGIGLLGVATATSGIWAGARLRPAAARVFYLLVRITLLLGTGFLFIQQISGDPGLCHERTDHVRTCDGRHRLVSKLLVLVLLLVLVAVYKHSSDVVHGLTVLTVERELIQAVQAEGIRHHRRGVIVLDRAALEDTLYSYDGIPEGPPPLVSIDYIPELPAALLAAAGGDLVAPGIDFVSVGNSSVLVVPSDLVMRQQQLNAVAAPPVAAAAAAGTGAPVGGNGGGGGDPVPSTSTSSSPRAAAAGGGADGAVGAVSTAAAVGHGGDGDDDGDDDVDVEEEGEAASGAAWPVVSCDETATVCRLTGKTPVAPVVASDGYTYDRVPIEQYLMARPIGELLSPVTGQPLFSRRLWPNFSLRSQIAK